MTASPWFVIAPDRLSGQEPEPGVAGAPGASEAAIELDICADSPLCIDAMPDGGLNITCFRLEDRSRMVTMRLRFTPTAAANLIGGLYRAVQWGLVSADEEEPPSH